MTEPTTDPGTDPATAYATALLVHYGFELAGYKAEELVQKWQKNYGVNWVRLAVIEALYQGRYKAVSVEQILAVWARRKRTLYHFNHEFERLISRKLPQSLVDKSDYEQVEVVESQNLPESNGHNIDSATKEHSYSPLAPMLPRVSGTGIKSNEGSSFTEFIQTVAGNEQSNLKNNDSLAEQQQAATIENNNLVNTVETDANSNEEVSSSLDDISNSNNTSITSTPVEAAADVPLAKNSTSIVKYEADWSRVEASKQPIHQFTPCEDGSDFYLKLKAVAQPNEEAIANSVTSTVEQKPEARIQNPESRSQNSEC